MRSAPLACLAALLMGLGLGPVSSQTASEGPAASAAAPAADAAAGEWQDSTSLITPSKYAADFQHFDYVNPDAPKGGRLNETVVGTFDSFNPFVVRGTPAAGLAAFGGGLLYDTLMEQSPDEPGVSHALIAEAMRYPNDYSSVTFRLDPEARWHDGEPITVDDVIWSFETLTQLHPQWTAYYKNVTGLEETGEREVTFTFDQTGNRELPNIMGDLTILPKHWWESTDAAGNPRDISEPTSETPLGSGPYRIADSSTGQWILWERVEDYWGLDNPTRVGRYNYGSIRYVYLRDSNAAWEAFKKGGLDDWRLENMSRRWAEGYDFPAAQNGQVVREEIETEQVQSMQAYVLNNRLPKFQDRRVRKALTLAYNFEEMNRTLFFGLYDRIESYFENSELAAKGLPSEAELKYLEPLRGQIPDEVFTEEFTLPEYGDAGSARNYLREALGLLKEAGYELRGTTLVNAATGEPFTIEFLGSDPQDTRTLEPFARQLERLGIQTNVRIVDTNQYIERLNNFDFEVVGMAYYPQSLSPGNEQRDFWSSTVADVPGSRNYAGLTNPAVDRLIDAIVFAEDREDLVAATRALDRVMLWEYYAVPQWYKSVDWLAYWDKLEMPENGPHYAGLDPFSWWIESAEGDTAAAN
ncbi:MAG TPA: extracellular solute-binding protein [Aurantimonas sp.]|nr:extracellular solute-binding protein [Aurantimonas sp.]